MSSRSAVEAKSPSVVRGIVRAGDMVVLSGAGLLGYALRHGVDPRLQLELACVRIARLGEVLDVDGLLALLPAVTRVEARNTHVSGEFAAELATTRPGLEIVLD